MRTLNEIAHEIRMDWHPVNYAAKPYLDVMAELDSPMEYYGYDSGHRLVLYFLSNARTWKGETAKRIKAELKAMVK